MLAIVCKKLDHTLVCRGQMKICDAFHEKGSQVGKTNFTGKRKNRIQVKMSVSSFFAEIEENTI